MNSILIVTPAVSTAHAVVAIRLASFFPYTKLLSLLLNESDLNPNLLEPA